MSICVLLRGLSLLLIISSVAIVITALVKERFLDRAKDTVIVGLFNLCVQGSCSSEFGSWFNGNAKPQWHAFQAFLLLETMMKVLSFLLMKKRPALETKYANRKTIVHVVLIIHMISSIIFGCIAVACYIATVNTIAGWPEKNYQPSDWAMGISGLLIIIAWPVSVIAYGFYCLGWRFEVEKSMVGKSDEPLLLFGGIDSQQTINQSINQSHIQLQPQQIAVNMNGQIVMATLSQSPSFNVQPTNQPTNQPLIQPVFQPTAQPVFQPFNQPMYQPNNQQYQQPINQPVLYMPNPAMQVQPMIYGSYPQGQGPLVVMNGQPIPLQAAHQQFQTDNQSINQSINQPINSADDANKKDSSPMNQTIFGGEFSSSL